jgi:hypothetical protein
MGGNACAAHPLLSYYENSDTNRILELIKGNEYITNQEIATTLSIGIATVKRNIKKMKGVLIDRMGNNRTGHWVILDYCQNIAEPQQDYTSTSTMTEYERMVYEFEADRTIIEENKPMSDDELREEAVESFPEVVKKAWRDYENAKKLIDPWIMIPAKSGGICFTFINDQSPLLIASIPQLKKLEDAVGREEKRDENELYKLLIQKMPLDKDGELVFQLDEVADIHESVAEMLQDIDTVDVLTTFGDTDLESLQESSAASQSADRIEKYRKNVWDALGRGNILFNPDGSSSLAYAIKKDEALMIAYLNMYETWIKYHINDKFSRTGLTFDFEIIPTTVFNRDDL